MLHVFLFILKIIGIILAALLGLLLLILLLLLFVPIRYRGRLRMEGDFEAAAKVTWLLHMVSVPLSFREGVFTGKIKVFGITVKNFAEDEEELKEAAEELFQDTEEAAVEGGEQILKAEEEETADKEETKKSSSEQNGKDEMCLPMRKEDTDRLREDKKPPDSAGKRDSLAARIWKKIKAFFLKIFGIWEKIRNLKYTFRRFCVKIRKGVQKYRDTKEFLMDERTKKAFSHCMEEGKLLLVRLLPKKIQGELRFGMEDPALTGEILGGISIFYPVFKDNVKVYPDFEQSILEGELFVKGGFRLVTAALILWRLWRDKNVLYVYHKLRGRE